MPLTILPGPPAAGRNLLTNPGFEVWARGNGPFVGAVYGADRWVANFGAGSAVSVQRDSANADLGSLYCMAVTYTQGTGNSNLQQVLEDYAGLRGRVLTLSMRVKCATPSAVRLMLVDSSTNALSAFHSGSGAYETLTATLAVAAGATLVHARVLLVASCTAYADAATLVVGSAAVAFAPPHPATDLLRCQRYYQEIGGLDINEVVGPGLCLSGTVAHVPVRLVSEMVAAPTVTVSAPGDWAVYGPSGSVVPCVTLTYTVQNRRSIGLTGTVAAGLLVGNAIEIFSNNTLAARIKFEANP